MAAFARLEDVGGVVLDQHLCYMFSVYRVPFYGMGFVVISDELSHRVWNLFLEAVYRSSYVVYDNLEWDRTHCYRVI